jgi:hypothetical protein
VTWACELIRYGANVNKAERGTHATVLITACFREQFFIDQHIQKVATNTCVYIQTRVSIEHRMMLRWSHTYIKCCGGMCTYMN